MITKLNDTELMKISGGMTYENENYVYIILNRTCSCCGKFIQNPKIRLNDGKKTFLFCSEKCLERMGFIPLPGYYEKENNE